jgi:CheY-like chemotaxis protein
MSIKRILIVDDEALARTSLADFLHESGYDTATAADGESALQLQRQRPFDLCIVDIRMPHMDGVEIILALHQVAADTHFIIYTGSPQFILPPALKALGLSARHVVRKPLWDMGTFLDLVAQVAAGREC